MATTGDSAASGLRSVSIIIPSLNSPILDRVVAAILAQEGGDAIAEVVVVGKDKAGLLPDHSRVRLVDTIHPVDASTARNLGIKSSCGDLLIFLDSDCIPQPGWLQAHVMAHAAGHQVVGGSVLPEGDNYWQLTYNLTMFHDVFSTAPARPRPFLATLNLSVDRTVIDTVGGLDTGLPYSHDLDWTTRMREAGFEPWFAPDAVVKHEHSRHTLRQVWADCAVNGQYARIVRVRHASLLKTPFVLRYPWLTRLLSPLIASWVTLGIATRRPSTLLRHIETLPAIYMTKIAWCWGAGRATSGLVPAEAKLHGK